MQIVFSYNKKKVIQALRYHFINRREIRVLIVLVNVFAILAAALFFFHKVSPMAFLLSTVLWLFLLSAVWYFLPYTVYKRASTFQQTFKLNFSDYGVSISANTAHAEWSWKQFSTYIESPHFIHLYFDSKTFFLVPKAAIEEQADIIEVRRLLRERISKK